MVKIIILFTVVLFLPDLIQGRQKIKTEPCESKLMIQVKQEGLRSLNGLEIVKYYLDLRKCKDKPKVRLFKRRAEQSQLTADLENSKRLQGFTSSVVYGTLAIIIYLSLN